MAEEKRKSFLLYLDYREHFELLDDTGKGRLLMALFEYAESGQVPDLPDMERMAFSFIRKQMDRDNQKWKEKAQRSRDNGVKGGRPKTGSGLSEKPEKPSGLSVLPEKPEKPTGFSGLSEKPKKPVTVTGNVNVNVIDPPYKSPQGESGALQAESLTVKKAGGAGKPADHSTTLDKQRFEEFWREYPKKMGNGAAEKAWMKIRPDKKLFEKIMSTLKAIKRSDQWRKDNGQYIPYPSKWLNERRWEDEIPDGRETSTRNHEQTDGGADFRIPGITEL